MAADDPQHPGPGRLARARDWWFRDRRTGRIVVAQWPNLPLWLTVGFSGASWLLAPGAARDALRLAGAACLAWWAVDEMARGVNPWRRCLGGAALAGALASLAGAVLAG